MVRDDTLIEQELLEEARARGAQPLAAREGILRYGSAAAFVVVAAGLWVAVPPGDVNVSLLLVLVAALAGTSRIEFEMGPVYSTPVQLVLVPLLLLFPPAVALPAVAAGLIVGMLPEVLRGQVHPDRLVVAIGNAWFAVGPVIVLALAGADQPSLDQWPLYLAVLAAQFAFDGANSVLIEGIGLGVPRSQLRTIMGAWVLDALLSPVALAVAYAALTPRGPPCSAFRWRRCWACSPASAARGSTPRSS